MATTKQIKSDMLQLKFDDHKESLTQLENLCRNIEIDKDI